jgi:hypothetical protein
MGAPPLPLGCVAGRTPSAGRAEPTCASRTIATIDLLSARRADTGAHERRSPACAPAAAVAALVEYNYTPPIHFAVREGHLPIVELLVERGADLAYPRRGQLAMVELLLARGADVKRAGMPWATPMAWALKNAHERVAERLRAAADNARE